MCLAFPVTGGGRTLCVSGFEVSAALTFKQPVQTAGAPVPTRPGTHCARCLCPGAAWHLTCQVIPYVGAASCLSTSTVAVSLFISVSNS